MEIIIIENEAMKQMKPLTILENPYDKVLKKMNELMLAAYVEDLSTNVESRTLLHPSDLSRPCTACLAAVSFTSLN